MPYCASLTTLCESVDLENVAIAVYHVFLNFSSSDEKFFVSIIRRELSRRRYKDINCYNYHANNDKERIFSFVVL